jgi:hypothetical protein
LRLDPENQLDTGFHGVGAGLCYILEERGLAKGDFDKAEAVINDARKSGLLPIEICAEDESRQSTEPESIDDETPNEFAEGWINYLKRAHNNYTPISFWENQPYYVEMLVEKIDLKSLFQPDCDEFRIRLGNTKGWLDINQRARILRRFQEWEVKGKQVVLLYCGDHDPAGLDISNRLLRLFEDLQHAVGWNPSRLLIVRFGLNADFINANRLTWIDGLKTSSGEDLADRRHPDHKALRPGLPPPLRSPQGRGQCTGRAARARSATLSRRHPAIRRSRSSSRIFRAA